MVFFAMLEGVIVESKRKERDGDKSTEQYKIPLCRAAQIIPFRNQVPINSLSSPA